MPDCRPALDRDDLHRLLAAVRRWIEAGAVEIRLERTRGGYRVLGTLANPPADTQTAVGLLE